MANNNLSKAFRRTREMKLSMLENEITKKQVYLASLARRQNADLPENVEKRKIANEEYQKLVSERAKLINELEAECKNLFSKLYEKFSRITDPADISIVIESNAQELAELNSLSAELLKTKPLVVAMFTTNYYDELFITLSNKVMPEFLLYLNSRALKDNDLPFSRLNRSSLIAMNDKIVKERPELLADQSFMEKYGYLLPSSIGKIKLDNQSLRCKHAETRVSEHLKRFPENYPHMDPDLKVDMAKTGELNNMFGRNRQLIKYMTVKEISFLAGAYPKSVGLALFLYPDQLERILEKNPSFFNDPMHIPSQIFQVGAYVHINGKNTRISKQMYEEALKDYIDSSLELAIYFRLPENNRVKINFASLSDREKLDMLKKLKEQEATANTED